MVLHIFTIVNIKKGPTITDNASYSMSSCPVVVVIAIPGFHMLNKFIKSRLNIITKTTFKNVLLY